jgi:hypothetical protein
MAYKHRKYPEWSWSLSRDNIFKSCLRKYYYQYYKSHNGWEWDAPEENKKVYRLKKLQSTDAILGNSVHHLLHKIIHDHFPVNKESLNNTIKESLNNAFRSSQNKAAWEMNPSKNTMLKEIYYNNELSDKKINLINYKIDKILNYIENTDIIEDIKESYYVKSFDTNTFETIDYKDTKVYAIPDLIYQKDKNKLPCIVDWKTGKEKNSSLDQLKLYSYYYFKNYNYEGPIKTVFVYLYEQQVKEYEFKFDVIDEVKSKIDESINKMKSYLEEKKWNKPKDKVKFKKRENDIVCSFCKYRELCNR